MPELALRGGEASGTSSSRPRRRRCRSWRRCWSPRSASTRREPYLEKLLAAEGVNARERLHAAQPAARRQPGQGGEPARGAQPRGALPEAAAGALRGRAGGRARPATTPPRSRRSARAADAAPRLGDRRRSSRRRCCRSARPPRRPSASATSSRRIPSSREARLNYARVLVLDKRFPEARKQFEALLAAQSGQHRGDLRGRACSPSSSRTTRSPKRT